MGPDERADGLNSSQKFHLLASFQYADKLLCEIEAILEAAGSKSPFPKYRSDLGEPQAKVVRDYLGRLRARMVRALESQGIRPPEPQLGAIHSIRVTLGFADIAFEECRPQRMKGYGRMPEEAIAELEGSINELQGLIARLDAYLAQAHAPDLGERLARLEQQGRDVGLVGLLEGLISKWGLVEFRPALAAIVERLEGHRLEIAVFGRVSSGKSSLLNHILQTDVLPVGVTPVTAVPTRILYGPAPRGKVWFAGGGSEEFPPGRLAEFVSEDLNPGNAKNVTRLIVELPSERLRNGVVFVDTPGLGSLASAGAAETRSYLPRCDLAVVLVDAGATLTPEDLSTVQALHEGGIPAWVLLSKADLPAPGDLPRLLDYVSRHVAAELGLAVPVHPVSTRPGHAQWLEQWFEREILPLYEQSRELAERSLRRKIGALRAAVAAALESRLKHAVRTAEGGPALRELETALRQTSARFSEVRSACLKLTEEVRELAPAALREAARMLAEGWRRGQPPSPAELSAAFEQVAAAPAGAIAGMLGELAQESARVLAQTARALELPQHAPEPGELVSDLSDLPRLGSPAVADPPRPHPLAARLSRGWAERALLSRLRAQVGPQVSAAFAAYGRVLQAWVRTKLAALESRFDSYADAYRAQFDRLEEAPSGAPEQQAALLRDLAALGAAPASSPPGEAALRPERQELSASPRGKTP